jgi:hypothetical protein
MSFNNLESEETGEASTTKAFENYSFTQYRLDALIYFVNSAARSYDANDPFREFAENGASGPLKERFDDLLGSNSATICELLYCRMADNFELYIQDLLFELIRVTPKAFIGAEQQLNFHELLGVKSIEEILSAKFESKAEELARFDLNTLRKRILKDAKFDLFADDDEFQKVYEIVQTRHLFVHNNGRVTERYRSKLNSTIDIGSQLVAQYKDLATARNTLSKAASDLDQRAIAKWNLY